jgi:hypothetical protein
MTEAARGVGLKKVVLCDNESYYITDEDSRDLQKISPGLARLVRDCGCKSPTHFVCPLCGQIAPLRLRRLHCCRR